MKVFKEVNDKLPIKEWFEKIGNHLEEMKNRDKERAKMYDEEGKKCHACTMKNPQAIEKECEKMNADELINSVKSSCGL